MNGGGPAFPTFGQAVLKIEGDGIARTERKHYEGMTLRDYFAAKAMHALINPIGEPFDRLSEVPEYAYQIADAMLEARQK